jgi:hypothetical protein
VDFGQNVEDLLGHARYLGFYLVCGMMACLAQVAIDPQSSIPSLGASGAVAGVLGAYVVLERVAVVVRDENGQASYRTTMHIPGASTGAAVGTATGAVSGDLAAGGPMGGDE